MAIAEQTPVVASKPNFLNRLMAAVPPAVWSLIVLLVLWEVVAKVGNIPNYILPAPTAILAEMIAYWPRLLPNSLVTAGEVVFGFLCAVLIGVPIAVVITYSRFMERSVYPLIVASQTVPKVAIAPLLLTWFGYGLAPKIVIVVLLSFFPIVINSVMGLKSASREMIYLARSMGASPWQQFWKFRMPHALPSMFAGFKLATVLAVIGAIIAEFIGADKGLGYLILVAGSSFNITRQFAAIILITIIGVVFFWVIERLERFVIPWRARGMAGQEG